MIWHRSDITYSSRSINSECREAREAIPGRVDNPLRLHSSFLFSARLRPELIDNSDETKLHQLMGHGSIYFIGSIEVSGRHRVRISQYTASIIVIGSTRAYSCPQQHQIALCQAALALIRIRSIVKYLLQR